MLEVVSKAAAFVCIIIIGYVFKKIKIFEPTDYRLVSKIIFNITLPAAIITNFAHFQMDYSLLIADFLGLFMNVFKKGLGMLLTRRDTTAAKILYIFSLSGQNIGCFALPFAQAFLSPIGVIAICLFDVGNSIMCTGLTYALTASCVGYADGGKDKFSVRVIVDKLVHSASFMWYISMLAMALLGLRFPAPIYTFTKIVATANPFLSMLMIGMMFEITLDKKSLSYVKELFCVRYFVGIVCAAALLYFAPFAQDINYAIILGVLAPCTIISMLFIETLHGNVNLASLINSITIVVSVTIFSFFFVFTQG